MGLDLSKNKSNVNNLNLGGKAPFYIADKQNLDKNTASRHTHENKEVLDGITASYTTDDQNLLYILQAQQAQTITPENLMNISYLFADGRNDSLRGKLDTSYAVVMDYTFRRYPYAELLTVRADSAESMQSTFNGALCTAIELITKDLENGVKFETSTAKIAVTSNTTMEFATPWLQNNKPTDRWDMNFHFTLANGTDADGAYSIRITGLYLSSYNSDYCGINLPKSTYYKITKDGEELTLPELRTNFATHFGVDISEVASKKISMGNGNSAVVYKCGNGTPKLQFANHIFYGCSNLTSVTGLDLTNATTIKYAFSGCTLLTSIDVVSTENVTDMSYAFYNSGISEIIGINTHKSTNLDGTFAKSKVTELTLDCTNVITAKGTFTDCTSLLSLTILNASADVLSALFSSLPETESGTITLTDCLDITEEITAIATEKGWNII